ncbi:hypothetical protein LSCM1_04151 [Leishmania martiniquensis]|uniref:Uncharacterized protein n=1 Tax=Leishmania martiniquensis TaxID=1580590 RepID=A0A836H2M0_9TRYP|nr:hypothetical protein LSCM1_04151 [Leishmania martiniquensis]
MGSVCSSGEDARHRRENRKNRINPTETYDNWQQKMLLDIGADPLAVIRDFPRMNVFVHSDTCLSFSQSRGSPISVNGVAVSRISRQALERPRPQSPLNPLARGHSSQPFVYVDGGAMERDGSGIRYIEAESTQHLHRLGRMEKGSSASPRGVRLAGACDSVGVAWAPSMTTPLPQPHSETHLVARGDTEGPHPTTQEAFCDDDAFGARMRRVREVVLLLSELCDERATFGAAFASAWDRLVAHSRGGNSRSNRQDSDAGGESAVGSLQDGRPPLSFKKVQNCSISLDVHQVLLNACMDSGMLVLLDDAALAPTLEPSLLCTAQSRVGASVPSPMSLRSGTLPGLVNRTPQPHSLSPSVLHEGLSSTATRLISGREIGPNYGAAGSTGTPSGPAYMTRTGRSAPLQTTPCSAAALVTTPGRYVVRSATFHLMQFTTQGVMFLPVQRLKHVLWMPWASHMQDVAWSIHFYVKEATPEDVLARQQHQLNMRCNTSASLQLPHPDSWAAGADGHQDSLSETPASTCGTADADGWKLPPLTGVDASPEGGYNTCSAGGGDSGRHSKVIVIQHVQTGRHYVAKGKLKTTPRYELEWVCTIHLDKDALLKMFAPHQGCSVAAKNAAAAPLVAWDMAAGVVSAASHRRKRLSDGEEAETTCVNAPSADTKSDSVGEAALSRSPVSGPDAALYPSPLAVDVGVRTVQPQQKPREVLQAAIEVVTARLEKPPHKLCMASSTWRKRKEELDYVLKQQYKVQLEQVDRLPMKMLY